jgi:23S rRNA (guanosine2251-2'-O)-methyltransferase
MTETSSTLEGFLSILSAIEAQSRPIEQVLIHEKKRYDKRLAYLRHTAERADITVEYVPQERIEELTDGNTHGGAVAVVGSRRFVELVDLIPSDKVPFIVMLDGIEDPFNFGYAIRAMYAAGVDGVVVRPRNWTTASSVVGRASAGAAERIPMAVSDTAESAAEVYRQHHLTIATTAKSDKSLSLFQANLKQPLFILIGGERRGVTRSFMNQADMLLEIPYGREFDQSLGTVSAVSTIAFEVLRQHQQDD